MKRVRLQRKTGRRGIRKGTRNPKAKGSAYERLVCKRLSMWVTDFARTDVFWRTASSGGRHTQQKKRRREGVRGLNDDAHAGDVCLTHECGAAFINTFVVEAKHHRDLELDRMIFGRRGAVLGFWEKLLTESTHDRQPFLVMRQNNQPEVVLTTHEGYRVLRSGGNLPVTAHFPRHGIHAVLFRDVLTLRWPPIQQASEWRARRAKR